MNTTEQLAAALRRAWPPLTARRAPGLAREVSASCGAGAMRAVRSAWSRSAGYPTSPVPWAACFGARAVTSPSCWCCPS